jgi:hypothetical protein
MTARWYWFPGYLWSFVNTLLGLLFMPFYGVKDLAWRDGCLEVITKRNMIGDPDAQTWGWLIYYRTCFDGDDPGLRVHERTHVLQAFFGGPLFLVAYGVCFLYLWARQRGPWTKAYRANPFEQQAYARQGEYTHAGTRFWGAE